MNQPTEHGTPGASIFEDGINPSHWTISQHWETPATYYFVAHHTSTRRTLFVTKEGIVSDTKVLYTVPEEQGVSDEATH